MHCQPDGPISKMMNMMEQTNSCGMLLSPSFCCHSKSRCLTVSCSTARYRSPPCTQQGHRNRCFLHYCVGYVARTCEQIVDNKTLSTTYIHLNYILPPSSSQQLRHTRMLMQWEWHCIKHLSASRQCALVFGPRVEE